MAIRKTRPRSPAKTRPEESLSAAAWESAADDVPATAGMLRHLRTELIERIEQGDNQLRGEMRQMKDELRGEMRQMGDELRAGLAAVQNDVHDIKANMARVLYLTEEQNARNRVVLEGLTALAARQDRVERRVDAVEATVRDLASSRGR